LSINELFLGFILFIGDGTGDSVGVLLGVWIVPGFGVVLIFLYDIVNRSNKLKFI